MTARFARSSLRRGRVICGTFCDADSRPQCAPRGNLSSLPLLSLPSRTRTRQHDLGSVQFLRICAPDNRRRFEHHTLDLQAGQITGQFHDRFCGGIDLPDLGDFPAGLAWMGNPGAHHPGGLGHIDRRGPRDHRAVVLAVDLDRLTHWLALPPHAGGRFVSRVARRGAVSKGMRNLTGVLEATVLDPSSEGPRRLTDRRPQRAKENSASTGNPPLSHQRGTAGRSRTRCPHR